MSSAEQILDLPRADIQIRELRHITPSDFDTWLELGPAKTDTVRKLSSRHRRIASMVARGCTNKLIAQQLSICPQTIVNLKKNPAFLFHVEAIEKEIALSDGEYLEAMTDVRDLALEKIHEKLAGDMIQDPKELRQIALSFGDRTGYGPSSHHVEEHRFGITPDTLAKLKSTADELDPASVTRPDSTKFQKIRDAAVPAEEIDLPPGSFHGADGSGPVRKDLDEGDDFFAEEGNFLPAEVHPVSISESGGVRVVYPTRTLDLVRGR